MSSEKQGGPPSYDQVGGYPPAGTQPGFEAGYPPPQQPGYQPVQQGYPPQPQAGYPGQQYAPGPQYAPAPGQAYTTQQVIVAQPGQAGVIMTQSRPPDYMVPSILACLCCFCPTGICAIYYASQANSMAASGDMAAAQMYSSKARNLMIASVVIGVVWIILVVILRVVVYSTASTTYNY